MVTMEEKRDSVKAKTNSKARCERKPNGRGGAALSLSLFFLLLLRSSIFFFFFELFFHLVFIVGLWPGICWVSLSPGLQMSSYLIFHGLWILMNFGPNLRHISYPMESRYMDSTHIEEKCLIIYIISVNLEVFSFVIFYNSIVITMEEFGILNHDFSHKREKIISLNYKVFNQRHLLTICYQ